MFLIVRLITIISVLFWIAPLYAQDIVPDTVSVQSGSLALKGLLWQPSGVGPFPALIFCHGSWGGSDTIHNIVQETSLLGPVFVMNGYMFLGLFRRDVGLSKGQGENSSALMEKAFKESGQQASNEVQLQQLESTQLQDMISGLAFLRSRKDVDTNRIAVIGHSFGGLLSLLLAEYDHSLKAVVMFSGGGRRWDSSPHLRTRLIGAAKNITSPVMIIYAQNDYSTKPGYALDSVRKQLNKPNVLKIYPKFGSTPADGHSLIFQSIDTWKADVLNFLNEAFIVNLWSNK